jgi:RimJ/RimL family protein N-acetyltransferase
VTATAAAPRARSIAVPGDVRLDLRAVSTGDRDALGALFARMSLESRHMRFLTSKTAFSQRELIYFTDVDHLCHEAFVAIDERDGSMVAVARYVWIDDRPWTAEVAAEVVDELQGLGIGTALAQLTVNAARDNGFELLRATTLADNNRARALLCRLGFRPTRRSGRELEFVLTLDRVDVCRGCRTARESS